MKDGSCATVTSSIDLQSAIAYHFHKSHKYAVDLTVKLSNLE